MGNEFWDDFIFGVWIGSLTMILIFVIAICVT